MLLHDDNRAVDTGVGVEKPVGDVLGQVLTALLESCTQPLQVPDQSAAAVVWVARIGLYLEDHAVGEQVPAGVLAPALDLLPLADIGLEDALQEAEVGFLFERERRPVDLLEIAEQTLLGFDATLKALGAHAAGDAAAHTPYLAEVAIDEGLEIGRQDHRPRRHGSTFRHRRSAVGHGYDHQDTKWHESHGEPVAETLESTASCSHGSCSFRVARPCRCRAGAIAWAWTSPRAIPRAEHTASVVFYLPVR